MKTKEQLISELAILIKDRDDKLRYRDMLRETADMYQRWADDLDCHRFELEIELCKLTDAQRKEVKT